MKVAKYLDYWLAELTVGCVCKQGLDHQCKYLDFHPEDGGSLTCKKNAPFACYGTGNVLGAVFETKPKDEDKDCLGIYKLFKKLRDSCISL